MLEIKKKWIQENYGNIEWEAIAMNNETISIRKNNMDLETPTNNSQTNFTVRVILEDNKEGYYSTTNIEDWKNAFTNAVKIAKVNKAREHVAHITSNNNFSKNDSRFNEYNEDKVTDSLNQMNAHLNNKASLIESNIIKSISTINYENHNDSNISITDDAVMAMIGIGEGHRIGYSYSQKSNTLPDFNKIVDEAINYYNYSKKLIKFNNGVYDCLFAHDALNTIMSPVYYSIKANNVVEKKSQYINKLGEKIMSEKLTIIDNPLNENNKSYFDMEGNKARVNTLIEKGILKTFIHDNYTSSKLGMNNTFNSSSILIKPSVDFHTLTIKGKDNLKEMIEDTKKGFIFYDLYPGHTINAITGTFGLNSSTFFYIEDGEIKGLAKEGVVTGNTFEILKNIDSISKESRNDLGDYELPVLKTKTNVMN